MKNTKGGTLCVYSKKDFYLWLKATHGNCSEFYYDNGFHKSHFYFDSDQPTHEEATKEMESYKKEYNS